MKVNLIVAEGKHEGRVIPITVPQFVIGRQRDCQIRASSPIISKHHCALMLRGGKAWVRDFDSSNGTFINDEKVSGERELHNEDCLKVGPLVFLIWLEEGLPEQKESSAPRRAKKAEEEAGDSTIMRLLLGTGKPEPPAGILGVDDDSSSGSTLLQAPGTAKKSERPKKKETRAPKEPTATTSPPAAAKVILDRYKKRTADER
jgi:predicted component of type VI protein secretion system